MDFWEGNYFHKIWNVNILRIQTLCFNHNMHKEWKMYFCLLQRWWTDIKWKVHQRGAFINPSVANKAPCNKTICSTCSTHQLKGKNIKDFVIGFGVSLKYGGLDIWKYWACFKINQMCIGYKYNMQCIHFRSSLNNRTMVDG